MQRDTEKCQEKTVKKTIATTKGIKRRILDAKSEEAYAVMKQLSSNVKKRDDFDVYGEYVAGILRNLKSQSILVLAKYEINNALYRAEIADIPSNTPQPVTTPEFDTPASTPLSPITIDTDTQSYNRPGSSTMTYSTNTSATSPIQTDNDTQSYAGAEDMSEKELSFTQMLLDL